MREIEADAVTGAVTELFKQANHELGEDVLEALWNARLEEASETGRQVLDTIIDNAATAAAEQLPLCQDCGVAVVFLEIGQDAHITGGDLYQAVNEGVRRAYTEGYLRKSMVARPASSRDNTGDNTPAVIHADIVPGDRLKITALSKGGGAENVSRLGLLLPAAGRSGIAEFVSSVVEEAGSKPCPPVIVGVGVGGTAEKAMLLAKKALLRKVGEPSPDDEAAALEKDILEKINRLGTGPAGYGGRITALAVHVETFPAHITALPVAVNIQCHSHRKRAVIL